MQVRLPSLSVIMATYERPQHVAQLIVDLKAQKDAPPFEILICDDGSRRETLQVLESTCRTLGAMLLTQENKGFRAASARNMAIRKAQYEIAMFLDDDLRVLPNFLKEHSKVHSQESRSIALIGPRLNVPKRFMMADTVALEPLIKILKDDREKKYGVLFKGNRLRKARCPWKVFYTCNASVHLTDLRAIGGFDESFIGYGLEDNELAYRLFKLGIKFVSSNQIPVFHEEERNLRNPYKKAMFGMSTDFSSYMENVKRFVEKHGDDPDVQRVFSQVLDGIDEYLRRNDDSGWLGYQIQIF